MLFTGCLTLQCTTEVLVNLVLSLCRWKGNRFNILTLVGAQEVIRARLAVLKCSQ